MPKRMVADMRYAQSSKVVAKRKGLPELIERPFLGDLKRNFA
jgi:hypothetical protein